MRAIGYGIVVLAGSAVYCAALVKSVEGAGFVGLGIAAFGAVLLVLDFKRLDQPSHSK
jgi:hypothetical protein